MSVFLSILEEEGEAIISDNLIGPALNGNASPPKASDRHFVCDRFFATTEDAEEFVSRRFPNLKIIDKTDQKSQPQEYL